MSAALHVATLDDLPAIEAAFKSYKGIFPYVRRDYLQREIAGGHVIYDSGVVAIVKQFKRNGRVGEYRYSAGEWHLHELVAEKTAPAGATFRLFKMLLRDYVKNGRIIGCIREDNQRSIDWHKLMGFKRVANIAWKQNTIPGGVWLYRDGRPGRTVFDD